MSQDFSDDSVSAKLVGRRVFLFASLLFFLELLFFRLMGYLTHYLESTLVIAYALAGVAVGGLLAARVRLPEARCYCVCLLGTYLYLVAGTLKVLRLPSLGPDNLLLVGMFAFPSFYIARAFREHSAGSVYFADLLGAGMAVLLVFAAHQLSYLEMILLCTSLLLALAGLHGARQLERGRGLWFLIFGALSLVSTGGIAYEATSGRANFYYHIFPSTLTNWKDFHKERPLYRTYDNMVSRVEVYQDEVPGPRFWFVSNGMVQDGFRPDYPARYYKDPRVIGGFFEEPWMYIIGSSAQGILKTARYMTHPSKIHGSEINPAVLALMTEDFVKESAYALTGLDHTLGNALALLGRATQSYDIITLMNPHSSGQMFLPGPPDWLHTVESYELYLRRLSPDGYVMVEERPMQPPGFEILLKRLTTIGEALRRVGVENPADHLFIYSWHWNRYQPYQDFTPKVFTSIFVKRSPLTEDDRLRLMDWLRLTGYRGLAEGKTFAEATDEEKARSPIRFDYLPGVHVEPRMEEFFRHWKAGTLQEAYAPWDLTPVTDDRPFTANVDRRYPELQAIAIPVLWLAAGLLVPALLSFRRAPRPGFHGLMHLYQLLAGAAYILVEVFLMQLYQKHLASPSLAFVGTLCVLLVASGVGGRLLFQRVHPLLVALAFVASMAAHLGVVKLLASQLLGSDIWAGALMLGATAWSGFFMGAFLPIGLERARLAGHGEFAPDYFASNSVGGVLALVGSLYLAIAHGFTATAVVASGFYLVVAAMATGFRVPR